MAIWRSASGTASPIAANASGMIPPPTAPEFDAVYAARCGWNADLSGPVTDRALFHCDYAYYYPDVRVSSHPMKTNTVSNTAFRGFGGPQGVIVAERIIEEIAYATGQDTLAVRKANLYRNGQLTPYHQPVEDMILPQLIGELEGVDVGEAGGLRLDVRHGRHSTQPHPPNTRPTAWLDGRVTGRQKSVVVIGGGPGGYESALVAAQLGAAVTIVEAAPTPLRTRAEAQA